MAPELHMKKSYTGEGIDLFAAATILFVMVTQRPPFEKATTSDPLYKFIVADRASIFWGYHASGEPNNDDIYSKDFKDLFEKMVCLNRRKRLSMEQVLAHPWLQGHVPEKRLIQAEFVGRRALID